MVLDDLHLDDLTVGCKGHENEQQIITGYPIDGAMVSSGGGRVLKISVVCLHNKAAVGERHPGYYIALWDNRNLPQRHLYCSVGTLLGV